MSNKKILICLYAFYPFENANTNVMMPFIKALSDEYEVHVLTKNVSGLAPETENYDKNIVVHRYRKNSSFNEKINILAFLELKKKRAWYKNALLHIISPIARLVQRIIKNGEYKKLGKLLRENDYTAIISTCECFSSHRNVLHLKQKTKIKTPWIAYFMDPYSYYIENSGTKGSLLKTEEQVYSTADLILTTEEIYRENQTNRFATYLHKTHPFKFGNFKRNTAELSKDIFIPEKINCVYVGSLLNEKIRSPKYFYEIINTLDDRFHFHIICNKMTEANRRLYEETVTKKHNVTLYHNLPLNECLGIMRHADILINLGNKSVNQTPSKVFDYIGSARPIVNFYSLDNDTSKYYLQKYPCKINIKENEEYIDENASLLIDFAENYAKNSLDWDTIEKEYLQYQSDTVTKDTIRIIKDFFKSL